MLVGLDIQHHIQIARGPPAAAALALAGKPHSGAIVHPGRDMQLHGLGLAHQPGTAAILAGLGNDLTRAAAVRQGELT